ncbi:MAG: O-antigen ligase family protein [Actinobacteria bacterium]|nr:O-antigen ligase family protein [Actinomycetota bacterium]
MRVEGAGIVGPIDQGAARRAEGRLRIHDGYRLMRILTAMLLVVTLDVTNYLDTGSAVRYLILIVPIGGTVLLRLRRPSTLIRRPAAADRVLFVLMILGLLGSVYGRLQLGTGSTALPVFVPMLIAFLHVFTLEDPTEGEVRKLLIAIAAIGLLYVALNALANSGYAPMLQESRSFRNSKVLYIALGFVAILMAKQRFRLFLFICLAVYVFLSYPSATSAMVSLTTLITMFVTRRGGSNTRVWIVALVAAIVLVAALFNFNRSIQVADDYFLTVGKQNNTNTRLALWTAGIHMFQSSPLIGDVFSGETTVEVARRAGGGAPFKNPYNNDYILFAASGGVVGLGLLVLWIVLSERSALRRYRGFVRAGQRYHAALMRALLVGFNGWLTAATFNPLFQGMARSVTLFAIYGLMMSLGEPAPVAGAPPAPRVLRPLLT